MGHRVGHKTSRGSGRVRKGVQEFSRLSQKVGGAMATAGGVMPATGIGAVAGGVLAGSGAIVGGVGGIAGGVERFTREKDTEGRLDATKDIIVGGLGARGGLRP